jgi:hypothetical protein
VNRRDADWFAWEAELLTGCIRPSDTVLELGAATGCLTTRLAWRAAWVTAVEPDPERLAALRENLCITWSRNVTVVPSEQWAAGFGPFDVVIGPEWPPRPSPSVDGLARLLPLSDRVVVLRGWDRAILEDADAGAAPYEPIADLGRFASALDRLGLEARPFSNACRDGRRRLVLIAGRSARGGEESMVSPTPSTATASG